MQDKEDGAQADFRRGAVRPGAEPEATLQQEKLLALEVRYRRLFETAKEGILILDADTGVIVDVNPFLIQLLDSSHEEICGKELWQLVFFKDIAANRASFLELLQAEYVRYEDLPLQTVQGRRIEVEFVWTVYRAGSRKVIQCNIRDITERKQAEEELRKYRLRLEEMVEQRTGELKKAIEQLAAEVEDRKQAQEGLRSVIDNIPVQVYWKDTDSRFVSVNLVTARFFGAACPDDIIGKCDFDFFPRQLAAQFLAEEQALLHRDQPCVNREAAITDSEGNTRWIWTTKVPMRDSAGKITGLLGINRDITERKRSEERARLARETLELVNRSGGSKDAIHDILAAIKKSTGFEAVAIRLREDDDFPYYVTKGFPETFVIAERSLCARDQAGNSVRDGKGNPVLECMCGNVLCGRTNPALPFFTEGGSFWSNCTTQLLATTTEADRQARTRDRCNSEGYESVALIPLRADGEIIGLLQLNDHRRNQFTLEMIRFFEGLGATVGVALFRKRTEEALRESEERFRLIVENSNDGILVADATTRRFLFGNQGMCQMLGYTPGELMELGVDEIHPQKDLPTVVKAFAEQARNEIELASLPLQRKDGSVFHADVKAFPLDLEGKACLVGVFRDITERKQAEQELEKYQEHLEELVGLRTAALEHANERLDADDKARAKFVSILTHELKAPLASMGFEIANLLDGVVGPVPDRVTEYLRMLNTDCHRMTSTVQDVLDLSRLESKTMRLSRTTLLFDRLIRRAATALRSQAEAKNIEMILSTAPGLGFVECDAFKMERVIINIIGNAIKFTPDGGRVEIGLQRETTTPGALVLEVTDTGIGIAAEDLASVTERYFRVGEGVSGTGLGLSIAKEIVDLHGGRLAVQSPPPQRDRGTTVSVSMPMVDPPTVLIVDEDETIRCMLEQQLCFYGYQVIACADGEEAFDIARRTKPDVAIFGVSTSTIDGDSLVSRVKADQDLRAMPIVATVGGIAGPAEQESLNGLQMPILPKPWREEELLDCIEAASEGTS